MPKTTRTRRKRSTTTRKDDTTQVDPGFARVVEAFANDPRVSYGKLFASMGLKVDGRIFAMHVKGKLVAKLPKVRVDELVRSGCGQHFDPGHGRPMKEWVVVDTGPASWLDLAREAHRFVKSSHA
jgi:TfoX/Sxy family transcriptional regulator of competence genes